MSSDTTKILTSVHSFLSRRRTAQRSTTVAISSLRCAIILVQYISHMLVPKWVAMLALIHTNLRPRFSHVRPVLTITTRTCRSISSSTHNLILVGFIKHVGPKVYYLPSGGQRMFILLAFGRRLARYDVHYSIHRRQQGLCQKESKANITLRLPLRFPREVDQGAMYELRKTAA